MNVYVGNLSHEVTEEDLRQTFKAFGQVESVTISKTGTAVNQEDSDLWRCPIKLKPTPRSMA